MIPNTYLSLNGYQLNADKEVFKSTNRAFRYGDALFETIRCIQQIPMWFHDHYQRLINGMSLLQMDIKSLPPSEVLQDHIISLIKKNRLYGDVRARLTIYREDGGLYTPTSNKVNYLIEVSPLQSDGYQLNSKGLFVDVYTEEKKAASQFSQFKNASALLFVLAGIFKQQQNKDDVLILNSDGWIIEGLASNLFWIKDERIYTSMRSSGCVNGIMRKQVIKLLKNKGWTVNETSGADMSTLFDAQEIFMTNAIQGIQWVVGLQDKRFYCKLTKEINQLLQKSAISYRSDFQES
ncbi:MAG: aminotransferase class IV [Carboxylicivirga sp.]|jgi:branched-chain amino acid aminotransferase|nr:aminotransferase class IV [Carboxylicivirga sp.]